MADPIRATFKTRGFRMEMLVQEENKVFWVGRLPAQCCPERKAGLSWCWESF